MAVDPSELTTGQFVAMMALEGNPPPGKEYDLIRVAPDQWAEFFPAAYGKAQDSAEEDEDT